MVEMVEMGRRESLGPSARLVSIVLVAIPRLRQPGEGEDERKQEHESFARSGESSSYTAYVDT